MKALKPHLTRAKLALKQAKPKQRDRIRHRVRVLELAEVLRGSPRQRVRVGAYRLGKSENASA